MAPLLFFDPLCPRPYGEESLREGGLAGTEASTVRIAEALDAWVAQHNRTEVEGRYRPPSAVAHVRHVVVLRDPRALEGAARLFPGARFTLWVHDRIEPGSSRARWFARAVPELRRLQPDIVCVSDYQRARVAATLAGIPGCERLAVRRIYNPVDDAVVPDGTPVDPTKLLFLSSPNKGLRFALDAFRALRRRMPDLRLCVGNPGYKSLAAAAAPGVEWLGSLPHARVLTEARAALCTFSPNFVIPETFGLVFAESHAVGTPVLTYDCGAAREVLGDVQELLPVTWAQRAYEAPLHRLAPRWRAACALLADRLGLFDRCIERIGAWREGGRPRVGPDPRFRLSVVAGEWRSHLGA
ncbi:MAG TPA: glycosyltransferase family 4 protein [Steroidobacteraceae bacterium]|nr:glycosyltransferase family 4 protein [Steroidobacteraceae bacterium]